jgi:predicted TIM-barrel fold metal-dependent hydrolase
VSTAPDERRDSLSSPLAPTDAATRHRIDVHHHHYPPLYQSELERQRLGVPRALEWRPAHSIEDMDAAGVATAVLSLTAPGLAILDPARLRTLARECNDFAASMRTDYPGRFGLFATLPLPDVDASLAEIDYALDMLCADGLGVLTSYGKRWLGDALFAPVMDTLNDRAAILYVHPTAPDCCRQLLPGIADWVIEFPVDTVRAVASLLFSGTMRRCPRIRFIFSHLGGALPMLVEHLVRAAAVDPALAGMVPDGVLATLRRHHYDTALRAHATGLASALKLFDVSSLLFGTDAPLRKSCDQVRGLQSWGFSAEELWAIDCGNARRLMPRYML